MKYWVYILKCADSSYYTGFTNNLDLRVKQHMLGAVAAYTKSRLPVELVYAEACDSPYQAKAWEKQIRVGHGQRKKHSFEGILMRSWSCPNQRVIGKLRLMKPKNNL